MKNILSENMLRFGTKNLTESHLKNILTEAKAPVVYKASMLNITKKEIQPFVDTINATMDAIAKEYKQKFPEDGETKIRQGSPYVVLKHNYEKFGDRVDKDVYQLRGDGNINNWNEAAQNQKGFFVGDPFSFNHYIDSNENTEPGEALANGTRQLTKKFNNNGQFDKSKYDQYITDSSKSEKIKLKLMLFGSIPKGGNPMLKAFIMMSKYIARHRVTSLNSLAAISADNEIYNIILKKYPPVVAAISSQIDQLVEKKYAQFAAAIDKQTPQ